MIYKYLTFKRERAAKIFQKIKLNLVEIKLTTKDLLEIGLKIDLNNDTKCFSEVEENLALLRKKFGIQEKGGKK